MIVAILLAWILLGYAILYQLPRSEAIEGRYSSPGPSYAQKGKWASFSDKINRDGSTSSSGQGSWSSINLFRPGDVSALPRLTFGVYDNHPTVKAAVDLTLKSSKSRLGDTARLAVFIIATLEDPLWAKFFMPLSLSVPSLPMCWSVSDRSFLQIPWLIDTIMHQKFQLLRIFSPIQCAMPGIQFSDFRLTWAQVSSRASLDRLSNDRRRFLYLLSDEDGDYPQGVPLDLDSARGILSLSYDTDMSELPVRFPTRQSRSFSNVDLLFTYGFLVPDNPYLSCRLFLDGSKKYKGTPWDLNSSFQDRSFTDLIAKLRKSKRGLSDYKKEVGAIKIISQLAASELKQYGTSIADDLRLLQQNNDLTLNQNNALLCRIDVKICLSLFADMYSELQSATERNNWFDFNNKYTSFEGLDNYTQKLRTMQDRPSLAVQPKWKSLVALLNPKRKHINTKTKSLRYRLCVSIS